MVELSFSDFQQQLITTLSTQFGQENVLGFWGHPNAKVVSISQAPSALAVAAHKPFADKSGQKLRQEWYQISDEVFYNPANFYFTAVGRYYPGKGFGGDKRPSLHLARH